MKSKIKIAAALTALTVATTFAIPSSEAQAHRRWGPGLGLLAAGVVLGTAAVVASQNAYAGPSRCWRERQFDAWGRYMGKVTVCSRY